MARYRLLFKESVAKDFHPISQKYGRQILNKIEALADDPCPIGCEKLTDQERYRIRCGSSRIIYEVRDDARIVLGVKVAHRRDASAIDHRAAAILLRSHDVPIHKRPPLDTPASCGEENGDSPPANRFGVCPDYMNSVTDDVGDKPRLYEKSRLSSRRTCLLYTSPSPRDS